MCSPLKLIFMIQMKEIFRHLAYDRVHLPLYKVLDTPFHIQADETANLQAGSYFKGTKYFLRLNHKTKF